jgi:hypothetical protein
MTMSFTRSVLTKITCASASATMTASSATAQRQLKGTIGQPALPAPNHSSKKSSELFPMKPMGEPGFTPCAISWLAMALERRSISA